MIISNDLGDRLEWRKGSGNTVEILDIVVRSQRRHGIGTQMVKALVQIVPPEVTMIWAITRFENLIAREFYQSLGFRTVGYLTDFYKDGENHQKGQYDAILYGLDIERRVN